MKDTKVLRAQRSAALWQRQFLHGDGSLFDPVFDTPALTTVLAGHGTSCRERLYPPLHTLRLFIGQVLSSDRACQDVVGRRLSERIAQGQPASALNTGSYCDARQRRKSRSVCWPTIWCAGRWRRRHRSPILCRVC